MIHGQYVNPGNSGFKRILNAEYIDKTAMISRINKRIDSPESLICISRPRRFGKSFAAQMLCAYYDSSCDSHELFDKYKIAKGHTPPSKLGGMNKRSISKLFMPVISHSRAYT